MVVENKSYNFGKTERIDELYTEDTVTALNAALAKHGIDAGQIISVQTVPGQGMVQPMPPRFRVLYRSNSR